MMTEKEAEEWIVQILRETLHTEEAMAQLVSMRILRLVLKPMVDNVNAEWIDLTYLSNEKVQ